VDSGNLNFEPPDEASEKTAPTLVQAPESQTDDAGGLIQRIRWKRMSQVILDAALSLGAIAGAFAIRFDGSLAPVYWQQLIILAPLFICLRITCNWLYGVYRRLWRYTGLTEVTELALSCLTVSTLVIIVRALNLLSIANNQLSYGIICTECGLAFLLLVSPRVLRRLETEHRQRKHWRQPVNKRALIVGAGDAGQMVARELSQRGDVGVDVIGLIDDDPQKVKKRIGRYTVFGTTNQLAKFIEELFIDQVVIAMPSAPPSEIRRIVEICRNAEVQTRILPGLYDLIGGKVSVNQLREVSLEDLLGREPVDLDTASIATYIEGRRVLITGAGGSIGSELCRQIIKFQPKELLLLGKGENSIFSIYHELKRSPEPVALSSLIADVGDQNRMANIFEKFRPQVVFHAAAHKHVPLMEDNVSEAISNNIGGTKVVAELSHQFGVETFVLVSSDKAVNPTSVMGATKRIAELIVQDLSRRSKTKYAAVRFGNVLDSRGSVIPFWREQIANGGPLTVTHKDVIRYFMLIPEAVQLIIQAGALANGGEIFVLDMGKPVKMIDMAYDLIKLSGLRPNIDIDIQFIGLRPGEKLFEELLTDEEGLSRTATKKILVGKPQPTDASYLARQLDKLFTGAAADDEALIRATLSDLVGGNLLVQSAASPVSAQEAP
jgi:FlaA1/EpsC-like NDP-sugar epimerase